MKSGTGKLNVVSERGVGGEAHSGAIFVLQVCVNSERDARRVETQVRKAPSSASSMAMLDCPSMVKHANNNNIKKQNVKPHLQCSLHGYTVR